MPTDLNDLCRLCAKANVLYKDLREESNKNILKLIHDLIQITIKTNEELPTKVCLNCEEKMVSFQLFILECFRAQDTLKELYYKNCNDKIIKEEEEYANFGEDVKNEVKDEMNADDIISAINEEDYHSYDDMKEPEDIKQQEDTDSDDNCTIATLKDNSNAKKKDLTEDELEQLNNVMRKDNLSIKDFVKFNCNDCSLDFKSWNSLKLHCKDDHKIKPIIYCLCGFPIKSLKTLRVHINDHRFESRTIRKKKIPHKKSGRKLKTAEDVKVQDYFNFSCMYCQKQCGSWYGLKAHCQTSHHVEAAVTCTCGLVVKSKTGVYKHVKDHNDPDVLRCDKCPRISKSLTALNKHKMRHIPREDRKYECSSCDKVFATSEALKSHSKSHIPVQERKIFACDQCNLRFTTRTSLNSHKRIVHEKIKSYICDLCGYACGTGGELRQHRAIHSEEKPFVCSKCSKSFKTYSNLKTHMDTHEDTAYECYICRRVLNSRRTLRKHLLVHDDRCRHVCSYCNKAFKRRQTLKVHLHTHTGDKPLSCKWCDERFSYASTLRSHRLRCHAEKMAAQMCERYANNSHVPAPPTQDFIKYDLAAINAGSKNEVAAENSIIKHVL